MALALSVAALAFWPIPIFAQNMSAPFVVGLHIPDPLQGGDTWLAGEEMQVRVFFNEAVEVTGTPRLALTVGDRTAFANYDWHNEHAVQFRYTVQATDRDADGISIAAGALTLNGGTIADASGNAANLSLASYAITNDPGHKVDGSAADTVRPRVTGTWLSSPPQGGDTWLADEEMQVRVFFNEAVEVTGTPRVALTIGDRTAFANYDWHNEHAVQFRYTVQATDRDADGISIAAGALTLNGGTIADASGNAANLSLASYAITNDPGHKVDGSAADTVRPRVTGIWLANPLQGGGDTWLAGEEMQVRVFFNEAVEVTGTPRVALTIGDRTAFANYDWHNEYAVHFRYTVQATDRDADGISIAAGALTLNGGTIADASGNAANLSLASYAITNDPGHKVDGSAADTVRPRVTGTGLSSPPQGGDTWLADEEMQVRVFFNEAVEVTGTPRVALTIGDRTAFANYDWHNEYAVQFRYTVQATDRDADGISIAAGALTLNGGTIADASGNAANLSLASYAITNDPGHKVDGSAADTVRPRVTGTGLSSPPQGGDTWLADEEMQVRVFFNEAVEVTGTPRVALTIGDRTAFANYDWHNEYAVQFRYTVQATDRDADGISIAAGALTLNGGTIADASGNAANLSLASYAITNDPGHKVDGSAADTVRPRVTGTGLSSPPQGGDTWLADEEMRIQVYFNEAVEVTGTPRVALTIGDRTAFANYFWHNEYAVHFRYTVQATDRDADGLSIAAGALTLNGGTIADASGNAANLSLASYAITNDPRHKVDGSAADMVRPRVTGVWLSEPPDGGDTWHVFQHLELTVAFNELVQVTGQPRLALTIGGTTAEAVYVPPTFVTEIRPVSSVRFRHVIRRGDVDSDGISMGEGALILNGGTIQDASGNDANLDLGAYAFTDNPDHKVGAGAVAPQVVWMGIANPPPLGSDTWYAGERIEVQLRFSEEIAISGAPTLALAIGDQVASAAYGAVWTTRRGITFEYEVKPGDRDDDGISIAADALALNGGSIQDNHGNVTEADLTGHTIRNDPKHKVDGRAPPLSKRNGVTSVAVVSAPRTGNTYRAGEMIRVRVRFRDDVAISGKPSLDISVGGVVRPAKYESQASARELVFGYAVVLKDWDTDGISVQSDALARNHAMLRDRTGKVLNLEVSGDEVPDDPAHRVAGAPARLHGLSIASTPQNGDSYRPGETIEVTAAFDRPVRVSGKPRLGLTVGAVIRSADYAQNVEQTVIFRYQVAEDDWDADGISIAADAVQWADDAIQDELGLAVRADYEAIPDQPDHKVRSASGPEVLRTLPSLRLVVGAAPVLVDLAGAFLRARDYDAESLPSAIVNVAVSGSSLRVVALSEGETEVRVVASNDSGSATQRFDVDVVSDPAEVQAVEEVMEALSRSLLAGATDVIRRRMVSGADASRADVSSLSAWRGPLAAGGGRTGGLRALLLADRPEELLGTTDGTPVVGPIMDNFELSLVTRENETAPPGIRWTIWGAADQQSSSRGADGEPGYDSELRSPYLGVDIAGRRWLAGVAAARSIGIADYEYQGNTRGTGRMETRLTGIHPYLKVNLDERTEVWGIMGAGGGDFEVDRTTAPRRESGSLRMWMGALGARRNLADNRGVRLALQGDIGMTRLSANGAHSGVVSELAADAKRIRVGAEASLQSKLSQKITITPSAEVAARFDAGKHLEGSGLEAAGGFRLAAGPRFDLEARGRVLVLHTVSAYREGGVSLSAHFRPSREGRGLSLAITPRWGAAARDVDTLWRPDAMLSRRSGAGIVLPGSRKTNARVGYGFSAGRFPGIFQWFGGLEQSVGDHQQVRAGVRYALRDDVRGMLEIELVGERTILGARAAHRLGFRVAARY